MRKQGRDGESDWSRQGMVMARRMEGRMWRVEGMVAELVGKVRERGERSDSGGGSRVAGWGMKCGGRW